MNKFWWPTGDTKKTPPTGETKNEKKLCRPAVIQKLKKFVSPSGDAKS